MTIEVTLESDGHVAKIVLSKPPHNFACPALLREIAGALYKVDNDPQLRCSLLVAKGRSFCAGADLAGDETMAGTSGMAAIGQLYSQAERLFRRRKPMVAAIQGAAIGAGLGLAMAADFRVADPTARLSANFTRLGFHPGFALTYTLPRVLGAQRASWMMLSSERVKSDTALNWGLVDRVVEEGTVAEEGLAMAHEIAGNAPLALLAVRRSLMDGVADAAVAAMRREHAEQVALRATADYAEGVASVFERRPAHFIGA
ncbi:enoyl-CoA hydratase/isomerase family protein [Novosphingobium sp. 1949]|uniref:Enoyl-CoA hydratase/isomerase family protein n=1 Tax=Novosphingobium organovorum TaxID=2930092 RepID=A0ABT0BCR4_9SPHN|nr:enoyl-CoA hydratase/isomerase family protein [Novosphingobium organovorum]MCJ2182581.1 enoyl-CoA hydratase/isomerase family protein [Novosphingobium organovorum]